MNPESTPPASTFRHNLWEWVKVIVIAVAISLPIRYFIAEPFIVQGASMDPTFSTGQFLIVDRVTYRFEQPARGDVIIFEYPNNPAVYYIKRIIGLPGETVNIKDGKVTVISPAKENASTTPLTLDETYISPAHASRDNLEIVLKPTEYFVMGDNRAQSSDSRSWGPLDKHFIIGRPIIRIYPTGILPGEFHYQ